MNDRIKDYFTFSKKEQQGLIVLLGLLLLVSAANMFLPEFLPEKEFDMTPFASEVEEFMDSIKARDSIRNFSAASSSENNKNSKSISPYAKKQPFLESSSQENKAVKDYQAKSQTLEVIELNSADSLELLKLKGIGPAYSSRIIKYRQRLGGFYLAGQLMEVNGMDTVRFNQFKNQVTVNPALIRKININQVSFKDLLRHPYFEYYLVKAIFQKKDEIRAFDSIEQLKSLPVMYDELYEKIFHYVTTETFND